MHITLSPLLSGICLRVPCTKFGPDSDCDSNSERGSDSAEGSESESVPVLSAEEKAAAAIALQKRNEEHNTFRTS